MTHEALGRFVARRRCAGLACLAGTLTLSGCADPGPSTDELTAQDSEAIICGTNDMVDVELYHGGVPGLPEGLVDYIAPHSWVRWWVGDHVSRGGSGALIGRDLMISACHVGMEVGYTVALNYQVDETGEQTPEERKQEFEVIEDIGRRLDCAGSNPIPGALDFNVYRLAGNPGNIYGWNTLSTRGHVLGEPMAVVGHPAGQPKQFSPGAWIHDENLWYDADTLGVSSGSPVLTATGVQVGVHTGSGGNSGCRNNGHPVSSIIDLNGIQPEIARAALSTIVPAWSAFL